MQTDREVMEQIQQLMRVHASELKSTRDKESKESEASKERRKAHEKVPIYTANCCTGHNNITRFETHLMFFKNVF